MNGRLENEIKIEKSINNKLNEMPEFISDWNLNLKASLKTASTRRDYIFKAFNFLKYINQDVKNIKPTDITNKLVEKYIIKCQTKIDGDNICQTSDSYRQTIWSCLCSLLEFLCDNNFIEKNYVKSIQRSKNRDLIKINQKRTLMTKEDFSLIVDSFNDGKDSSMIKRDKAIMLLFLSTGMRKTALTSIDIDDIDLNTGELNIIDKGDVFHIYNLNNITLDAIKNWIDCRDEYCTDDISALFVSNRGKRISITALDTIVKKYSNKALGLKLSPHKIRAGFVSIIYNQTKDIEFTRRAIGHSRVDTTQRYITTKGDEKRMASDIISKVCLS